MKKEDFHFLISSGLKAIAASFPIAASIAQAWEEVENKIFKNRVNEFFISLKLRIEQIENNVENLKVKIPKEEIAELLELCIRNSRATSSKDKRSIYVNTFLSLIQTNELSHDLKISIIETINTLTMTDISIFQRFIPNKNIQVQELFNSIKHEKSSKEKELSIFIVSLSKLESRGLINKTDSPGSKVYVGVGSPERWVNRWLDSYYTILPFGEMFRDIISEVKYTANNAM